MAETPAETITFLLGYSIVTEMADHGNVHSIESEEEFDAIIMSAGTSKLVSVDFYADWYALFSK